MSGATFWLSAHLRLRAAVLAGLGMGLGILMVGALFPAVGDSIGALDLPRGVTELLGGADYGSLTGWMRSEVGAVYGPLIIGAVAISAAAGSTAGEEEGRILPLVLAHPISRSTLMLSKAGAVAVSVMVVAAGTWLGLASGIAVGGGGISLAHYSALTLHLACLGLVFGMVALALAGATGRRSVASGGAAAFAVFGFLVNGFAPFLRGFTWLRYASPFHYFAGHDPLTQGVDWSDLAVLGAAALALTAVAVVTFERRDLRG